MAPDRIATFVMGPQAGGRGYRVLSRSDGATISSAAEGRLSELALVLAGWADEREAPAAALIPLADAPAPAVLMRIAYLGTASLGTIAYAHGLLLDEAAFAACGGRPETLLPLITLPDGARDFGETPRHLPAVPPLSPPPHDWNGLGLEWRDRLVLVPDEAEVEVTLRSVLASLGPATLGSRVRGWATTALLPSAGSFAPARDLQLLVLDTKRRRPEGLHHLPAHVTATGFDGERVTLSPAARAFARLKAVGRLDAELAEAVAPLRWSQASFDQEPVVLIGAAADAAIRRLAGGGAQMRLVTEMARPHGDDLDADFALVARGLFARLVEREELEPQHAAFYLKALADGPPEAAAAMMPLGALIARPGSGRWLRDRTFARLLELGYARAAAEKADEAPALLEGLGAEETVQLLDQIMLADDPRLRPPALVSAALRQLADQGLDNGPTPAWAGAFSAALGWRLGQPPAPDEARLGSRSVVQATYRLARPLMARLAARAIRLRDEANMSAAEQIDRLGAALEWVRLEGASD